MNQIKLIKAVMVVLLLLCLANMPYGYFQLVRFLAMVVFGILALDAFRHQNQTSVLIYICLAVLFQPFLKIALGRTLWNWVDVIVACGLLLSLFSNKTSAPKS